jgi:hypothetical protein
VANACLALKVDLALLKRQVVVVFHLVIIVG